MTLKMRLKLLSTRSGGIRWELRDREFTIWSHKEYSTVNFAVRAAERIAGKMNIKVLKSKYIV